MSTAAVTLHGIDRASLHRSGPELDVPQSDMFWCRSADQGLSDLSQDVLRLCEAFQGSNDPGRDAGHREQPPLHLSDGGGPLQSKPACTAN
jgi:hypothetical protein